MTTVSKTNKAFFTLMLGFLYIFLNVVFFHPFSHNFERTIFMPGGDQESFIWFSGDSCFVWVNSYNCVRRF